MLLCTFEKEKIRRDFFPKSSFHIPLSHSSLLLMTALAKEEEECRFSGSSFLLSFLPSSVRITLAASRGRKWPGRKIHQLVLAFTLSGTRNKLMRWHFAQCSFKALVNFLPTTETHLFLSPPSSLPRRNPSEQRRTF